MISVNEALARVLALATALPSEHVSLSEAFGRVLRAPLTARRNQPPFAASVMDGYAVRTADIHTGAVLAVIGEAAAGSAFAGRVGRGQAARIFTGAPVPEGADRVVIQEDVSRTDDRITIGENIDTGPYIRAVGADFREGQTFAAPRRLTASDVALLASMNHAVLPVTRRPVVALIATGDELVMPGETPGPDQIIASNCFGLAAMFAAAGAAPRMLPIARDTIASVETAFGLAADADLIVTIGGASVGDHDLVAKVAGDLGMDRAFYKVAMRPGKPLMAGRIGGVPMIGLPGNPVSAMVCGALFVCPAITAMLGLTAGPAPRHRARLAGPLAANGNREHYMRAIISGDTITAADRQDSSLLSVLAEANALLVRPVGDPARAAGDMVSYINL